jgi:NAD(P)-dependent dehydrogenase (short-subunit alcohol dehydrogenase family)
MNGLTDKVVLITGAASGIGRATAAQVEDSGGIAVRADVDEGPNVQNVDVTDETAVAGLLQKVIEEHGRLDGVVHAAGTAGGGPVHLLDHSEWDRVIAVNLTGTFIVCKHAITRMLDQEPVDGQRGSIVTLASIEGLEGTAGGSAYNASKGGVVLLTKNIAIDYGRQGVRANAICPGFIETQMTDGIFGMEGMEAVRDSVIDEHKLRRMGKPEEIASVAAFLLSPASSFVSGQALAVDGAYTAGRDHGVTELMGL